MNGISDTIRNFLLTKSNYACEKCGYSGFNAADGRTILEVNHIDGDGCNHAPGNLEVICLNCHTMTPTYRGRNTGNGKRPVYYLRKDKTKGNADE